MIAARIAALDAKINGLEAKHGLTWSRYDRAYDQVWKPIEDAAWAAEWEYRARERRWQNFKALRHLWTAPVQTAEPADHGMGGDLASVPGVSRLGLRLGCTVAILLNRKSHGGFGDYDLAFWDVRRDGYGWSAWSLHFNPSRLRFSIESDGDSYY
jgi:hypothetical protein